MAIKRFPLKSRFTVFARIDKRQMIRVVLATLSIATSMLICTSAWIALALTPLFPIDIRIELAIFWVSAACVSASVYQSTLKIFELEQARTQKGVTTASHFIGIICFLAFTRILFETDLNLFGNSLLEANDGLGHLAILEGLEHDHTTGIYPLLINQDGVSTPSGSPYPIGSHFVSLAISRSAGIPITEAYNAIVRLFEWILFPFAFLALFVRVARIELKSVVIVAILIMGFLWRPTAELLQGPTTMSLPFAIFFASIFCAKRRILLNVGFQLTIGASLMLFHPSSVVLFLLMITFLSGWRIRSTYLLTLASFLVLYSLTAGELGASGYFQTWTTANISRVTGLELENITYRSLQFIMNFVVSMGRSNSVTFVFSVLFLVWMVSTIGRERVKDITFVLFLLLSTSLSGLAGIGSTISVLTYPWYASPQRFVYVWMIVLLLATAEGMSQRNPLELSKSRPLN